MPMVLKSLRIFIDNADIEMRGRDADPDYAILDMLRNCLPGCNSAQLPLIIMACYPERYALAIEQLRELWPAQVRDTPGHPSVKVTVEVDLDIRWKSRALSIHLEIDPSKFPQVEPTQEETEPTSAAELTPRRRLVVRSRT